LKLRAGDQQKPAYLNLKPNAVAPTLVDNGAIILEIQSRVKTILASFRCQRWCACGGFLPSRSAAEFFFAFQRKLQL